MTNYKEHAYLCFEESYLWLLDNNLKKSEEKLAEAYSWLERDRNA